jgi:hypothetical protein
MRALFGPFETQSETTKICSIHRDLTPPDTV